jgi:protein-S-isoprenylcysteine O-methyltransferase Ste14
MIYVIVQVFCIIYLFVNINVASFNALSDILFIVAVMVGVAAVVSMKVDNINIAPALKENHQLVTLGVYRWARHPMYTSVLMFCFGLMLSNSHFISQLIMLVLYIDLMLKASLEETLLDQRYPEYHNYQKNTGKFLPFL